MKLLKCEECGKRCIYKGAGRPKFCCSEPMRIQICPDKKPLTEEKVLAELSDLERKKKELEKTIEDRKKWLLEEENKKTRIHLGTMYDPFTERTNAYVAIQEKTKTSHFKLTSGSWDEITEEYLKNIGLVVSKRVILENKN